MDGETNWYVLYVRANTEARVMKDIAEAFETRGAGYVLEPFCPEAEYYVRGRAGINARYRKRPLFPGYVFLETDMPQGEFLRQFSGYIYDCPEIVRILRYGGTGSIALDADERMRFEFLFRGKRCIEHSVGVIAGDAVKVNAGPLVGYEGRITRINRHNRTACVKMELFGGAAEVNVALEIVEKY